MRLLEIKCREIKSEINFVRFLLICSLMLMLVTAVAADEINLIRMLEPAQDKVIIGESPQITLEISESYDQKSVLVLLDGLDVSVYAKPEGNLLSLKPDFVLASGMHKLLVSIKTTSGYDIKREFNFQTRQTENFNEYRQHLSTGLKVDSLLGNKKGSVDQDYQIQGNASYQMRARKDKWDYRADMDVWLQNQKLPVQPPVDEGLNLASYNLGVAYEENGTRISADAGNIYLHETTNTIYGLSRRGGRFYVDGSRYRFGAFAVSGPQVFGFNGGTGIGLDDEKNIFGASGHVSFFQERIRLGFVHAQGGESGESFGFATENNHAQGRVTGITLNSQLSENLQLEAEYDISNYDVDSTDTIEGVDDKAYGVRLHGYGDRVNYRVAFEHRGSNYNVIANPIPGDMSELTTNVDYSVGQHSLNFIAKHQFDNVEKDPARKRFTNNQAGLDYVYMLNPHWTTGLSTSISNVRSSLEPVGEVAENTDTVGWSGRIIYFDSNWNINFEVSSSEQDEKNASTGDSTVLAYLFTPVYQSRHFQIRPQFMYNIIEFIDTGVEHEQFAVSLDMTGLMFSERFTYGLTATYNDTQSSDNSIQNEVITSELKLGYRYGHLNSNAVGGTVGLRTYYTETDDGVANTNSNDWGVWLTLSVHTTIL